ncbi:MAG TPA: alpha/beta fold hydrolase [Methylomusa anaerophila]|uniref:Esterase n=1 Tax=Methylomusa anaerophila TaxID=1930071 RepID=A0A348AJC8_9FIRM|nr:alpha/beta fold hydrolase [Methylomusa anaerophila]BBB91176.1 esterase [Methylomusa anaerophila]HML89053.1 alpha/beta fold hydrolase [Methylomusa anaerophila]
MSVDHETKALKRKVWFQTFLVVLSILLVFLVIVNATGLAAGYIFYKQFCIWHTRFDSKGFQPLRVTLEEGIKNKHWQNVSLESRLGYVLQGTYLPNPTPSNNTVVFVHGIANSRLLGLWYAPIYLAAGYNVLVYDSRASGESGGRSVSWGYYEKYDLDQWIDWIEERHPNGIIGVHGVSMGAATALLHAEMNESSHRVKFYVADSGYTDLEELLIQQIDAAVNLHNPFWVKLLLRYSSIAANWQSGFRYQDVSPLRAVRNANTPILYLHGGADAVVPVSMSEQLYAATRGYAEKYIFPSDAHAMSVFNHQAEYQRRILRFMDTALKKQRQLF